MSFTFKCPNCQNELQCEEEWIGQQAKCPACNHLIIISKPEITLKPVTPQIQPPPHSNPSDAFGPCVGLPPLRGVFTRPPHSNPSDAFGPDNKSGVIAKNINDNKNLKLLQTLGCFSVYEHQQDLSNEPDTAIYSYFMSKMNVKKRQVLINLNGNSIKMQSGAMQWTAGNVESVTGLGSGMKAVGGFFKGAIKGMVTGESSVKPIYSGYGKVMLEPTYKYILLEDVSKWGTGGIVLQDSLFLACDAQLNERVVTRKNLSSLLGAGEGIFSLAMSGNGTLVLESPVPREEMFEFELNNSVLKIDGNMAIAWSASLELTVERSSKSLIGSMVNGEGLLNVYRGTGKVLMTPTVHGTLMASGAAPSKTSSGGTATKGIFEGLGKGIVSAITE